jgi:GntR family transcriptional regulator of vanillate catabolism
MKSPALARAEPEGEPDEGSANGGSQSLRAQLQLRELLVGGALKPGSRITELAMVDRLGMSRTPIRTALMRLQEEGLLEALPSGGFVVRDFSEADIRDAIELRGTLEGLAARLAAERGLIHLNAALLGEARDCIAAIDALLAAPKLSASAFSGYVLHNGRFHTLLAELSGSLLVQRQIERASALPFASPNSFVIVNTAGARARDRLVVAHEQHRAVIEAIVQGEGTRAEALMREHARNAHGNLSDALGSRQALRHLPGAGLIRRHAAR